MMDYLLIYSTRVRTIYLSGDYDGVINFQQ
jgi:hypothetical protein